MILKEFVTHHIIKFHMVYHLLQPNGTANLNLPLHSNNTTGAARGTLRLPRRWQRVAHNAGDYVEGQ
jgi:hypothetical protein